MTKVLMVLTSHDELGATGRKTGWYVPEAAHPWAVFMREGVDVEFASPRGGAPPPERIDHSDPVQASFLGDPDVRLALENTRRTADVDPSDHDGGAVRRRPRHDVGLPRRRGHPAHRS